MKLIGVKAAAELLGVAVGRVYKRTCTGEIPHVKDGYWVRFDADELRKWQREHLERQHVTLRKHVAPKNAVGAWTAKEAAAFLGRSIWWLYKQTSGGLVPHLKVGHEVRFPPNELRQWAAEQGLPPRQPRGWSRPTLERRKKAD